VPVTIATPSKAFSLVFAAAINSTNEANKAGGTRRQAVYNYLDVYGSERRLKHNIGPFFIVKQK
jgi:hypothetical protein